MPRIVTGALNYTAVVRNLNKGTYEYGSRAYFGTSLTGASTADNDIFALFFSPIPGELQEAGAGEITKLRVRLTLKKKTTADTESQLVYKIFSARQTWGSPSALYNIIDGGDSYAFSWVDYPNTLEASEITITLTGTEAYYAAQYGISVANTSLADIVEVTSYSMEADVVDENVPPVINLLDGYGTISAGKYWHDPEYPFTVKVDYTQDAGDPIGRLFAKITDTGGNAYEVRSEWGAAEVTIPSSYWRYLPSSGTLRVYAYSQNSVDSNTIELPYEIAHRDIVYTSHVPGAIIYSDRDVTIQWEAIRPDRVPSDVVVPSPARYYIYRWFDDEQPSSVINAGLAERTIPAAELVGHAVMHFAVAEIYGTAEEGGGAYRRSENKVALDLYIQQVAVTKKVTASVYNNLIEVSWTATGQTAYQVRVGAHESGTIWGDASSYKVPFVFSEGVYPVQVRIQDARGAWGEWTVPVFAEVPHIFDTTPDVLSATKTDSGIAIRVDMQEENETFTAVLIYRDGIMIAQLAPAAVVEYLDRFAGGECVYFARLMYASKAYQQSASVMVDASPDGDCIIKDDGVMIWFPEVCLRPEYAVTVAEDVHMTHYSGRKDPVAIRSDRRVRTMPLAYISRDTAVGHAVEMLAGTVCTFKNRIGMVMRGVVSGITVRYGYFGCAISFTLTQVQWNEELPYVWPDD